MNRRIVVGLILAWMGVAALHAQDFEHAFQQAQEAFELRSANAQQSLKAYLAENADPAVTEPIEMMCKEQKIPVIWVRTMKELGLACGIEVGAAAVTAVR